MKKIDYRFSRFIQLLAVLFVIVPASLGRAQEATRHTPKANVSGTETFIVRYVGDNGKVNEGIYGDDDNYWMFKNLLYLKAGTRMFDSGLRLDATLFHDPPYRVSNEAFVPGGSGYTKLNFGNDFRVERIYGTVHLGDFHVTAGDFYVSFGRGMVLSLIKIDDVGVDNALRGARLEYRIPRKVKAVLVGGVVNALNHDSQILSVEKDDPLDRIVGMRIEWEMLDALSSGVHGVYMQPRFRDEADIDPGRNYLDQGTGIGVMSGGASLELYLSGWHVYLEGNGQKHDNYRPPQGQDDVLDEPGFSGFLEVSYDYSPFSIKGEGIFYRHWLMEGPMRGAANNLGFTQPIAYHHMVTLEPVWMVINSFGNAIGGRLTGDLYFKKSDTQFTLATALIKYEGGLMPAGDWTDHPPTLVVHPILEVRQRFKQTGIHCLVNGGFRHEGTQAPEEPGADTGFLWHVKGDVTLPIKGPHSMSLKQEVRRHELTITDGVGEDYWISVTSLGYDWSSRFGVTGMYEFSDQTAGADVKMGDWTLPLPRQHYVWFMASVHLPKPVDGLTLRLIGGSQRGGVKCAGGICRLYPDAVGARLEAVYRF